MVNPLENRREGERWDDFVRSHPEGTPFHLTPWLRVLAGSYPFRPVFLSGENAAGSLSWVLPGFLLNDVFRGKRFVSLPFSDYGGPLIGEGTSAREVIDRVFSSVGKGGRFELRSGVPGEERLVPFRFYRRHIIDLSPGPGELMRKIDKRTIQYSIKKAEKSGIVARREDDLEGLEAFYRLNVLTRKKHGVPSQPKSFFKGLFDLMVMQGHASLYVARLGGEPIAAGVFLRMGQGICYKYNASDPSVLERKLTPNHLLTWKVIEEASQAGFRRFDFGRTSSRAPGLLRYKEMWGSTPEDLVYSYHPRVGGAGSAEGGSFSYRLFTGVWKRLPDPLSERLSPLVMRWLG